MRRRLPRRKSSSFVVVEQPVAIDLNLARSVHTFVPPINLQILFQWLTSFQNGSLSGDLTLI